MKKRERERLTLDILLWVEQELELLLRPRLLDAARDLWRRFEAEVPPPRSTRKMQPYIEEAAKYAAEQAAGFPDARLRGRPRLRRLERSHGR